MGLFRQRLEAELGVKPVRVARGQQHPPQPLQFRMRQDRPHQLLAQPVPTLFGDDKHIRHVSKGRPVGNNPCKRHLLPFPVRAKAK